jgi:flavin reductase (DIM6/NTAB) family NADH-FMN oxidoreductase RutF
MDADKYRSVMRHQAGAVTIIAVGDEGNRTGLTATAVCSLTDSPPMVIACVNRNASAHSPIQLAKRFSINMLARDQNELARRFSSKKLEGEARFDADTWDTLTTGAPVLKNAIANLDCEVAQELSFDTHTIFIGRVMDCRFREDIEPLLYFRGEFWFLQSN